MFMKMLNNFPVIPPPPAVPCKWGWAGGFCGVRVL